MIAAAELHERHAEHAAHLAALCQSASAYRAYQETARAMFERAAAETEQPDWNDIERGQK